MPDRMPRTGPAIADDVLAAVAEGRHSDPHSVLGQHGFELAGTPGVHTVIRSRRPLADTVEAILDDGRVVPLDHVGHGIWAGAGDFGPTGYRVRARYGDDEWARLAAAGLTFALSADVEEWHGNTRNLPYHAAWAAAHGLDREAALKAVTLHAAEILGVADRIGSLAPGKDADLIVTTGDPLEVLTDVVYMFIRGRAVPLETKHTRSYEKFRARPAAAPR